MPISPRSNQIPPLATRQPLRFSWWRRSTFSGFLLKQLSYLLLAQLSYLFQLSPPLAGLSCICRKNARRFPSCNIEHACWLKSQTLQPNLTLFVLTFHVIWTCLQKYGLKKRKSRFEDPGRDAPACFTSSRFVSEDFGGRGTSAVALSNHKLSLPTIGSMLEYIASRAHHVVEVFWF